MSDFASLRPRPLRWCYRRPADRKGHYEFPPAPRLLAPLVSNEKQKIRPSSRLRSDLPIRPVPAASAALPYRRSAKRSRPATGRTIQLTPVPRREVVAEKSKAEATLHWDHRGRSGAPSQEPYLYSQQ